MSQLVYSSQKGNAITDSLQVAASLGKRHNNVLSSLKCLVVTSDFRQKHYRASTYVDQKGECRPLVEMTAEGEAQLRHSFTQRRTDLTTSQTYFLLAQGLERIKIGQATDVPKQLAVLQAGCPVPLVLLLTLPNRPKRKLHQRFAHLSAGGDWFVFGPELQEFIQAASATRCNPTP